VLDLVQPEPAGWRFGSLGWKARRDEAGRENTTWFEHGRASKDGTGDQDKRSRSTRVPPCAPLMALSRPKRFEKSRVNPCVTVFNQSCLRTSSQRHLFGSEGGLGPGTSISLGDFPGPTDYG
jgi:hypothetical protein